MATVLFAQLTLFLYHQVTTLVDMFPCNGARNATAKERCTEAVEIVIWWIPYFSVPTGRWRRVYNGLLRLATSNFETGDTLDHWRAIHQRLHPGTITLLPARPERITPNLEPTLLHALTVVTDFLTACAYLQR